jgi:peptidoglycan/xylan/chitin deacetylase (PgdA/CDA1 family)
VSPKLVRSQPGRSRLAAAAIVVLLTAFALSAVAMPATAAAEPNDTSPTLVSLTFDDGFASQVNAQRLLAQHNMKGTFFVPSGFIGLEGRLTIKQIQSIQADGNEIGGHTVNHLHLPMLDPAEQARQICDDRVALAQDGLTVTSFAYPFASLDPRTEEIVKHCGYNSARSEEGLSKEGTCETCSYGESIPPADPYAIRTATPVTRETTVSSIKQQIIDAQNHGGGWVPIAFHEICDNCSDMGMSVNDFAELLDWLDAQASQGISVVTVNHVIGGDVQNLVDGPIDQRPDGQLVNASLETPDVKGESNIKVQCWQRSSYGVNTATRARVPSAHTGGWAEQITIGSWSSGDQKLIIEEDSGACAPSVKPGQKFRVSASYTSTAPTRFVVFYRNSHGHWLYWTQSPEIAPSSEWRKSTWELPPIPSDARRLSFGLQLATVGTLTTDDYAMSLAPKPFPAWPLVGAAMLFAVLAPTVIYIGCGRIRSVRRQTSEYQVRKCQARKKVGAHRRADSATRQRAGIGHGDVRE